MRNALDSVVVALPYVRDKQRRIVDCFAMFLYPKREIGVFKVQKKMLVKAAARFQHGGSAEHKAARTEINLPRNVNPLFAQRVFAAQGHDFSRAFFYKSCQKI